MKNYVPNWIRRPLVTGALALPLALGYAAQSRATVGDEGAHAACQRYWQDMCLGESMWTGNCDDNVYFVSADDLMRSG